MATIYKRINKNGSISWRVIFRRKGIKTFCASFNTKKEALEFTEKNEKIYCLSPNDFDFDALIHNRNREFN